MSSFKISCTFNSRFSLADRGFGFLFRFSLSSLFCRRDSLALGASAGLRDRGRCSSFCAYNCCATPGCGNAACRRLMVVALLTSPELEVWMPWRVLKIGSEGGFEVILLKEQNLSCRLIGWYRDKSDDVMRSYLTQLYLSQKSKSRSCLWQGL